MAGPWERYAAPAEAPADGPWSRYAAPEPQAVDPAPQTNGQNSTPPSALASFARGVARSALFGFADEAKAGVQSALGRGSYDDLLAQYRGQFQADDAANPVSATAGQLYGGLGPALATGGTALAGRAAAMVPNALLRAAGAGAATGAAQGFGDAEGGLGNRLEGAGTGALLGGAVGGAVGAGTAALGRVISPVRPNLSPEAQRLRAAATAEGIPLSIGQETGSKTLRTLESQLAQLPGSSAMEANAQAAQQRAFNAAVLRRAGVQADVATPDVLNDARQRIGGEIGAIANRNTLRVTPDLEARLAQIEDNLRFVPGESGPGGHAMHPGPVGARIAKVREMMQPDAAGGGGMLIPGAAYRQMDSELGRAARSASDGDRREALTELRQTLRREMDQSIGPADAAAWQQARRQYANLMTAAEAARGAGGSVAEGNISPLALRGALDRSTGGGYVWGRGDLNDLARIGQSVLRQPPDSGTAGRSVMNSLLTGSLPAGGAVAGFSAAGPVGAVAGAAAPFVLPPAVQAFLNSRAGRAWLLNQRGAQLPAGLAASAAANAAASD